MAFTSTGALVSAALVQIGLTPERAALQAAWEQTFGSWGQHVELLGLQAGVLEVGARSSVHFQEVMLRRPEIVRTLNQYVGSPMIQRVSVRRSV